MIEEDKRNSSENIENTMNSKVDHQSNLIKELEIIVNEQNSKIQKFD